jgi:hypothetical protein
MEWDKTLSNIDGSFVQQTEDEGFIFCGTARSGYASKALLLKTDSTGNEVWKKTYKGNGFALGSAVQQTNDKGYVLTGATTKSFYFTHISTLIIKTDEHGNMEWGNSLNKKTFFENNNQHNKIEFIKKILNLQRP